MSYQLLETLRYDSLATSHPVYVPVNDPDEINEIFDHISYGKVCINSIISNRIPIFKF